MAEIGNSINKKNIISVSRNKPVALVVGAASFLGSHLTDSLLEKQIQVIGIDALIKGKKENLEEAVRDKDFHLIIGDPAELALDLERLDYVFILPERDLNAEGVLNLIEEKGARCLLISSIELYGGELVEDYKWLKKLESKIAENASKNNLNVRVLRLGGVFGPRMEFNSRDPIVKLIQQALTSSLQKDITLEFSTRALYVSDAVNLAIKAVLSGATAQKVFDGVLPSPIKLSEIKQILLDPVWYEDKGFAKTELPPWPTPNLYKTMKVLHWQPREELVLSLRKTLKYFKDHEIKIPKVDTQPIKIESDEEWKNKNKEELESFKEDESEVDKEKIRKKLDFKINFKWSKILVLGLIVFVFYSLVYPFIEAGFGIFTYGYKLKSAYSFLGKGEFDKSLSEIRNAEKGLAISKGVYDLFEILRKIKQLDNVYKLGDDVYYLMSLSLSSSNSTILGTRDLYWGVLAITGEKDEPSGDYFLSSGANLSKAREDIAKAKLLLADKNFRDEMPGFVNDSLKKLDERFSLYLGIVEKGRAASILLPEIAALNGSKSYLVLLQNNNELRPTGGFIGSYAQISFEAGKLKKIDVNDIYAIDGQLKVHVEPPSEIKSDLGQKSWFLRDSNWESDFPTSAKQAEWFYTKETGQIVSGVISMDVTAMEKLLEAVGPLDITDYSEKITAENLFERAITHAETSFFAGSQAKKNFLTALGNTLFNKIFFSANPNWPGIVKALGDSLNRKHINIFLDDPKLFSYLVAQNWAGVLPRPGKEEDQILADFIAGVEANLGANKSNYYLERSYNLETVIGKDGDVKQRLRISYLNRSPSDTWPAGVYKNRFRIYLPLGTTLTRVLWGESNITGNVTAFVDYGRTALSMLLELKPKEQKILVIDYEIPGNLQFVGNKATYKLNVVKQSGTLQDPFVWTLTYPLHYKLVSDQASSLNPQERVISTDLSEDRSFEVMFEK